MSFRRAVFVATIFLATNLALASYGDSTPSYLDCVKVCDVQQCSTGKYTSTIPLSLRLTRWTCLDNCKYNCMHLTVDGWVATGHPVEQFYGKWPFWRFAGMQEPASVTFSVLNFLAQVYGYFKIRKSLPNSHPMKAFYSNCTFFGMNAWVWSAVFHTRDTRLTEKLDYFSAALVILNALYVCIIRQFHLYPRNESSKLTTTSSSIPARNVLLAICSLVYASHIYYLTSGPRFDYTYNMLFNLVIGLSHNFLWLLYSLPSALSLLPARYPNGQKRYRPSFVGKAAVFVVLTTAATCLELFDFPAWARVIDAHSLWHAATAPMAYFWYNFLVQDALDPSWREPLLRQRPE
ncbi:Per1-like protein [Coprinopsis marcescibilis]|uniref:Post-GPI attachment to proteins factor 3 n=1 Tax=Coprinopsis marcescibilis TaxID=230819 RepID=A0A5C3KS72_COPMA|nr:Per1-like protein [Coprinopsis marcescibilis]